MFSILKEPLLLHLSPFFPFDGDLRRVEPPSSGSRREALFKHVFSGKKIDQCYSLENLRQELSTILSCLKSI